MVEDKEWILNSRWPFGCEWYILYRYSTYNWYRQTEPYWLVFDFCLLLVPSTTAIPTPTLCPAVLPCQCTPLTRSTHCLARSFWLRGVEVLSQQSTQNPSAAGESRAAEVLHATVPASPAIPTVVLVGVGCRMIPVLPAEVERQKFCM